MFDYIGRKIMTLAKVVFAVFSIAAVVVGIVVAQATSRWGAKGSNVIKIR